MAGESPRRVAQKKVAAYHEACLGELAEHVGVAIDRYRAAELDAFEIDQVVMQYSRAAKELWKFCTLSDVELAASLIDDGGPRDWWERAAPRRR
jgi:hypothetical protein